MEVHDAAAFHVGQPDPFGFGECVEAGGRQRLVEKRVGVTIEPGARRLADVRGLPRAPARREVDVAFGNESRVRDDSRGNLARWARCVGESRL
jgi:hypothetical protein